MSTLDQLYAMDRSEAIALLRRDYSVFCSAVQEVYERYALPPIEPDDDSHSERIVTIMARQLRESGLTVCRGYFKDPEQLERMRQLSRQVRERADTLDVTSEQVLDQQLQAMLWPRMMQGRNSRASFAASNLPPVAQSICWDPLFEVVMQRAIGNRTRRIIPAVMVVDNLLPSTAYEFQWWHYDRLRDQYKVMVLLDKVGPENGPMQIVPRTHRFQQDRRIIDFACYAAGSDYGDLGYSLYTRYKPQTLQLTGEAGDIVIFDTRCFHAHGRPDQGERMTSTIYYNGLDTPLNRFWDDFTPPGETV